jgi:pimeloyl-ACP methyl ester carboxylesterase
VYLLYTHGLGGSPHAQPEIDEVFAPLGYAIIRVAVPYHGSGSELLTKLATSTFGDLCTWVHEGAKNLVAAARQFAPEDYVAVGDSLGGFISLVAAERDARISHCILLACSGDFCDAMMRLDRLNPFLGAIAGKFASVGKGDIKVQAYKAIAGRSDFQREFEAINTFEPQRLAGLRRVLMLGDMGDPVAPVGACLHFARGATDATVRMAYNQGQHHPVGREALERYAVPFLLNQPVPTGLPFTAMERALNLTSAMKLGLKRILRRLLSSPAG